MRSLHRRQKLLSKIVAALIAFGPWGVFLLGFIDSLGIPLPATMDALLILVAVKAPQRAYFTALMAVLGTAGGSIGLFLAVRHGRRLFLKGEPPPGRRQRFERWFDRYGMLTVFIPAVTPVLPLPLKVFVVSARNRPVVAARLPAAGLDLELQRRGFDRLLLGIAWSSSRPQSAEFVAMRAREISRYLEIPIDQAGQIAEKDQAERQGMPPGIALLGVIPLAVGLAYLVFYFTDDSRKRLAAEDGTPTALKP